MPSLDVVNEVDLQEVDNAINNTIKEIQTRYDFRDSKTEVEFNKKNKVISVVTEDNMKVKAVKEMLTANFVKRNLSHKSIDFQEPEGTSHGGLKFNVLLKEGISRENAKTIIKLIKDTKLKVQASIHDDKVRVTGKKIDDLQAVMTMLRKENLEIPVQFENMKS
ncbi:MAG: YajQ family cyclic di-GMP-binding protein [Bacteroidetes bacterium]|nr:YajQ family cyclic di-GMP-binding protein [Bacteroidota bacterium]